MAYVLVIQQSSHLYLEHPKLISTAFTILPLFDLSSQYHVLSSSPHFLFVFSLFLGKISQQSQTLYEHSDLVFSFMHCLSIQTLRSSLLFPVILLVFSSFSKPRLVVVCSNYCLTVVRSTWFLESSRSVRFILSHMQYQNTLLIFDFCCCLIRYVPGRFLSAIDCC